MTALRSNLWWIKWGVAGLAISIAALAFGLVVLTLADVYVVNAVLGHRIGVIHLLLAIMLGSALLSAVGGAGRKLLDKIRRQTPTY